jgi:very-short-patch-repair endonuclease
LRVRRQHPIGPYVVDFCVPSARLVVEVDGRSHDGRGAYDARRQRHLEEAGWQVLRVSNDDVLTDLDGVIDAVERAIAYRAIEAAEPTA